MAIPAGDAFSDDAFPLESCRIEIAVLAAHPAHACPGVVVQPSADVVEEITPESVQEGVGVTLGPGLYPLGERTRPQRRERRPAKINEAPPKVHKWPPRSSIPPQLAARRVRIQAVEPSIATGR